LTAASADEAAAPHAMPDQAGKGVLARRHLYMSAAVLALMVAGGAAGVRPAMAEGIDKATPTRFSNPFTIWENRPRSAPGGDILATGSGEAGVDVQVKLQGGYDFFG